MRRHETLSAAGPAVTIFGSARLPASDPYYKLAVTLGSRFARQNLAVITGGGPGIMEAANRGASKVKGKSIGLNIELPHEQEGNRFVNIPIIKFSVDWWNTLHQPASVFRLGGPTIHPSLLWPLGVMALGFTVLFLTLHLMAMRNEIWRRRVAAMQRIEARRAERPEAVVP